MTTSTAWSSASAICQLEWRPSPALSAALRVLGLLAALSVLSSDAPPAMAWPVSMAAIAYGDWRARRYRAQRIHRLHWSAGRLPELDGEALEDARLDWRGPVAFLHGRDGRGQVRHLAWWPDTLSAAARRELRRVAAVRADPATTRSVAP